MGRKNFITDTDDVTEDCCKRVELLTVRLGLSLLKRLHLFIPKHDSVNSSYIQIKDCCSIRAGQLTFQFLTVRQTYAFVSEGLASLRFYTTRYRGQNISFSIEMEIVNNTCY